jgi:hypothetical protein
MYAPYPTSGPAQKPEQIQPPRSVLNALKLMYAGAALEVLAVIIAVVTIGQTAKGGAGLGSCRRCSSAPTPWTY